MAGYKRVQGITIELNGDTTKLDKALRNVNSTINTTQRDLKDVDRLLKLDPKNTELLQQKQKLLADAVGATRDKLNQLKDAQEQAKKQLESGELGQDKYDALQREIAETEDALKKLEEQARNSTDALMRIDQAGEAMERVGGKLAGAGKTLTTRVTAPIVALGAAAVKTTADFDAEMSKVAAISGAAGDEFDSLRDKAREMGAKTKFSATEAGEAFEYMAMAGWKTDDMLGGIEGIMSLAAASGEDLASTSDIVTDALTAFGRSAGDAGHLADIMAAASSNANTNVSMMGETFKYAAPVAGSLGYTMEDTAVAIGLMANAGIKSSQAGTAIRSGLTRLAKPSKEAATYMDRYGISLTDASGNMYTMRELMEQVRGKLGGLSESEQAAAASAIFGKNAMSGWLAVINGSDEDWAKLTGAIDNCDGVAGQMAETMQDNLAGQLTILKSQLQELAISVGDILMPAIRKIVEKVQGFVDWLNGLDDRTKKIVVTIGLVVAAIGPVLLIVGTLIAKFGTALKAISKVTKILKPLKLAFGGISAPVAAVAAVVALLVAAFVHLWKNNEEFRTKMTAIWERVKETVGRSIGIIQKSLERLKPVFDTVVGALKVVWDKFCEVLAPIFEGVFNHLAIVIETVAGVITEIVMAITELFSGNFAGAIHHVGRIFTEIWEGICGVFANVKDTLINIANVILGWFGTDWETVWTGISTFMGGIWDTITGFFSDAWDTIKGVFEPVGAWFEGIWNQLLENPTIKGIVDGLSGPFTNAKNAITSAWRGVRLFFNWLWQVITGNQTLAHIPDTVKQPFIDAWGYIQAAWEGVKQWFADIWEGITDGEGFTGLLDKIKQPFLDARNRIVEIWNAVTGYFTNLWDNIKNAEGLGGILAALKQPFVDAWDAIAGEDSLWGKAVSWFSTLWTNLSQDSGLATVLAALKAPFQNAWKFVTGSDENSLWGRATSWFNSLWGDVSDDEKLAAIHDALKNPFKTAWEATTGENSLWGQAVGWFSSTWDNIKTDTLDKVGSIKSNIVEKFNVLKSNVTDTWNKIKKAIVSPIEKARDKIKELVDKIKDFFDFSDFHINTPHFSLSWNPQTLDLGWFGQHEANLPSLNVKWYRKAMKNGMILNGATIFGAMNGRLLGGGEAGPEAVVGVNSLMKMIQNAVGGMAAGSVTNVGGVTMNIYGAEGQDVRALADIIEERLTMNVLRANAGLRR